GGIRALTVTGVQTCALRSRLDGDYAAQALGRAGRDGSRSADHPAAGSAEAVPAAERHRLRIRTAADPRFGNSRRVRADAAGSDRSEERRVGKWRISCWLPC